MAAVVVEAAVVEAAAAVLADARLSPFVFSFVTFLLVPTENHQASTMSTGRIVGIILLVAAVIVLIGGGSLMLTLFATEASASAGGSVLGFVCLVLPVAVALGGGGVYLLITGRGEEAQMAKARQQREILNMVLTQGKVRLDDISLKLNLNRTEVEAMVRDLVGKDLFTGAVNWKDGILYSKEASQMKSDHKCPNCGGVLELAGKGVIECPFCGAEVFMHLA